MSSTPSLRGHHPKSYAMNAYLKKDLANENQKPKKVEAIKKKENRGLERHSVEERVPHCLSAPSTKALMRMNIIHGPCMSMTSTHEVNPKPYHIPLHILLDGFLGTYFLS
jgi:hypothetical protein